MQGGTSLLDLNFSEVIMEAYYLELRDGKIVDKTSYI